jgi:tRNA threonylcarbamoyl adenosine modification protein YeaZ
MKILAVEFSSQERSVAVAVVSEAGVVNVTGAAHEVGGRSGKALTMVQAALDQARVRREDIGCIAVGLGPGSYTGIRAAISLAQGWQLARNVRLVGVSSIECLAARAQAQGVRGQCAFVIDAQRREYYLAGYSITDAGVRVTESLHIVPQSELRDRLARGERLLGPDPVPNVELARLYPDAATVAKLAASHKEAMAGEQLEPIYLREARFVKTPPPREMS